MAIGSGNNYATTAAMSLSLPTPSQCGALGQEPPGKSWLELLNASLSVLDSHTHTPGSGVLVPAAGLNINADLPFGGNNATGLRSARFGGIGLGSLTAADKGCMLVSAGDLYFVDGSGNQIRMTSAGGIAGTPGSISGLASPASASYTPASKLFAFSSSSGVAANMQVGPLSVADATVSSGKAVTLSAPASLAANYSLTFPSALPTANALMSLSTAGAISAFGTLSGSDLTLAGQLTLGGNLSTPANCIGTGGSFGLLANGPNAYALIRGNKNAGDAFTDVYVTSAATRTAGTLLAVQNNGTTKVSIGWDGALTLPNASINAAGVLACGIVNASSYGVFRAAGSSPGVTANGASSAPAGQLNSSSGNAALQLNGSTGSTPYQELVTFSPGSTQSAMVIKPSNPNVALFTVSGLTLWWDGTNLLASKNGSAGIIIV